MAKVLMIQGTTSNAGKSITVAGLCRIFKQDGYRVAPFKSQNMALNSFITKDGLEMGRAQAVQAEACGIEPNVNMNPILLKPTNDVGSQVIVNGEVWGNMSAKDYFKNKTKLVPSIMKAFNALAAENDIIVIEGAGSPAEINLKDNDIVNMGMAKMASAPVLIVGDIDRGGVFASLYGTIALLDDDEKNIVKGMIINKFRGDKSILKPGLDMIENLTKKPVVGVMPYINVDIDDEDSLSERLSDRESVNVIDIAVIRLPRISNFTDFNPLEQYDGVSVRYISDVKKIGSPDLIIIPGTKNTMSDMKWLRESGFEAKIKRLSSDGTPIIGICGGYQMLGKSIKDPYNTENGGEIAAMGILDMETVFEKNKTRTRVYGTVGKIDGFFEKLSGSDFCGYEIHMGITKSSEKSLSMLDNGRNDSSVKGNILGSYIHGIFDEGSFCKNLIEILCHKKGVDINTINAVSYKEYKEKQYDILAKEMRKNIDMDKIYKILNEGI